jgi:hypothetical protein
MIQEIVLEEDFTRRTVETWDDDTLLNVRVENKQHPV